MRSSRLQEPGCLGGASSGGSPLTSGITRSALRLLLHSLTMCSGATALNRHVIGHCLQDSTGLTSSTQAADGEGAVLGLALTSALEAAGYQGTRLSVWALQVGWVVLGGAASLMLHHGAVYRVHPLNGIPDCCHLVTCCYGFASTSRWGQQCMCWV
jgi:hypothetical protein